ncbi:MAG: porin family protein [Proteobacteria bacterium]|nr:porin family protein [Pseudomonadota bacterium]
MNKWFATMTVALALLGGATAEAQSRNSQPFYGSGLYIGGSIGELIYREDGLDTMSPTIIEGRIGQEFNPYFAIEGRLGTGISRDESGGNSTSVQLMYGAYAKGILPVSPMFSVYGIAGVAGTQLHHNYPDFSTTDTGLSFGVGGELRINRAASATLEWARLHDGSNAGYYYTADHFVIGVNWRF